MDKTLNKQTESSDYGEFRYMTGEKVRAYL